MGSAKSQVVQRTAEIVSLEKICEQKIKQFKQGIKLLMKVQHIDGDSGINGFSSNQTNIGKNVQAFLEKKSWGQSGLIAKKSFANLFEGFCGKSTGELRTQQGRYVYANQMGGINQIFWKTGMKVVSGTAYGKTENQISYYYVYQIYTFNFPNTPSVTELKSILSATRLTKQEQVLAYQSLACDLLSICSFKPPPVKDHKAQAIAELQKEMAKLVKEKKYKQAAEVKVILKDLYGVC